MYILLQRPIWLGMPQVLRSPPISAIWRVLPFGYVLIVHLQPFLFCAVEYCKLDQEAEAKEGYSK